MLAGLIFPLIALIVGCINVVFRIIYNIGYLLKGPDARYFGVVPANGSAAILLVATACY